MRLRVLSDKRVNERPRMSVHQTNRELQLARRLGLLLSMGALFGARARAQAFNEYQVKAAFLYNFAKFVEWPPQAFKAASDPISICVLGENPFTHELEDAVSGKSVGGKGFSIRRLSDAGQASNCQVLFIASSERKRTRSILEVVRGSGVLTVGEAEGFCKGGGVINFTLEDWKLHFEINLKAADREKLKISSKLLGLARIVKD
jgi:hypothetical protein